MVLRGSSQDLALERHCKIVSNFAPSQSKNREKEIKCGVVLQRAIKLLLNLWVAFANSIVWTGRTDEEEKKKKSKDGRKEVHLVGSEVKLKLL